MTPRLLFFAFAIGLSLTALIAACGGGDDGNGFRRSGNLTDPRDVPTATPWSEVPDVVILDPNNIQPLPPESDQGVGGEEVNGETEVTPGECGDTYVVVAGDTPSGIAEKCGVTTEELLNANPGLDPRAIHAGDEINIPQGGE